MSSSPGGEVFVGSYCGARPLGRPLPPLGRVPQNATVPLHLIYAFARDPARDGRFEFYDPWQLEQACRQQCGSQRGMLSLAGAGWAWGPTVGLDLWVENAVESLSALLDKHRLVGLDINYEEGLEAGGFPEAMAALVAQLRALRPPGPGRGDGGRGCGLLVSVAPYLEVWRYYRPLLRLAGDSIDLIHWQVYAELESPDTTAAQVVAVYDRLAAELGGYRRLTLGVNTEPDQRRGAQLDAALDAFRQLRAKGIGGAFAWALDNSASSGYAAEAGLLSIAAERLPLERLPQQQPSASSRLRRLLCCSSGSSADG